MTKIDAPHESDLIQSEEQLIDTLACGCKPREAWRIGTEHEKFGFILPSAGEKHSKSDHFTMPKYEPHGIEALLLSIDKQHPTCWSHIIDEGKIIGLTGKGPKKGASISLEPAGQFELSGAPLKTLHGTFKELDEHLKIVRPLAREQGFSFFSLGFHPTATKNSQPWMPKSRYKLMRAYMPKVGTLGHDMMQKTCTVQVNLDFSSEEDMVRKMQLSTALQPVATAIFANSPFYEGKIGNYLSQRDHVWLDTDNQRCGIPPCIFKDDFSFKSYVQWVLDVPMYFIMRNGKMINVAGRSFRKWLHGEKQTGLEGEKPTIKDFNDHVAAMFPDVRLKQFIEMRGADAGNQDMMVALSAFWVGLLYDPKAFEQAWSVVKQYPWEDYVALRKIVSRQALNTSWQGKTLREFAKKIIEISYMGLRNRRKIDPHTKKDESHYLAPLFSIGYGAPNQAEHWIERYKNVWNGNLDRLFFESEI